MQLAVAEDHREQVVEVVRDAAGETAHRLHLLGLAELLLEADARRDVARHRERGRAPLVRERDRHRLHLHRARAVQATEGVVDEGNAVSLVERAQPRVDGVARARGRKARDRHADEGRRAGGAEHGRGRAVGEDDVAADVDEERVGEQLDEAAVADLALAQQGDGTFALVGDAAHEQPREGEHADEGLDLQHVRRGGPPRVHERHRAHGEGGIAERRHPRAAREGDPAEREKARVYEKNPTLAASAAATRSVNGMLSSWSTTSDDHGGRSAPTSCRSDRRSVRAYQTADTTIAGDRAMTATRSPIQKPRRRTPASALARPPSPKMSSESIRAAMPAATTKTPAKRATSAGVAKSGLKRRDVRTRAAAQ